MELVQECIFRAFLKPPLMIGAGPIGTRIYYGIESGEVVGDRLTAKLISGGEWALLGPDGYIRIDVRLQAETRDGALIYIQYSGLLEMNDKVQTALASGAGTNYGDHRFFINPRMETGDERYAWVNRTFFVGEGRLLPNLGVEYQIMRPA